MLSVVKFDILAVTESHLTKDVASGEIAVKGYNIARKDRKSGERASGGTLIYFSENLNGYERDNLKVSIELETCWVDITVNSQKLLIGCLYRPPGTNVSFYDKLKTLIEPTWIKRNNFMLLGDFNIDLLSKGNNTEDSEEPPYRFRMLLNMFSMKNVIKKPTRISGNTKTLIDLIITSDTSKIKYSGSYDSGCSDHHLVYAVTNLRKERPKPKLKTTRNYKPVDLNSEKILNMPPLANMYVI